MIERKFGTWRGLMRLGLAYGQVSLGLDGSRAPDPASVTRLVFVCHGNICRSAYAQARASSLGVRSAGFGLSTSSGKGAHPPVIDAGAARGLDLTSHRTMRAEDYVAETGDLLIGMEVRHLHRLAADPRLSAPPRVLLGRYAAPPVPHLHDPYMLSDAYLPTCLDRIDDAVRRLAPLFPHAQSDAAQWR